MVVAHGVLGAVYRQKFLAFRAAGFIVAPPHFIGHKAVRIAVDKKDRHLALRCGGLAVGVLGVKVAEEDRPQPPDGVGQPDRHTGQVFRQTFAGDLPRAGIAAVRHNAAHIVRQAQPGRQHHSGRPHRDAHQEDRHLRPEMTARPNGPVPGIVALFDAHRNGVPAAVAVGALVGQQHIVAQRRAERVAAQPVPRGIAAVSVEDDGQRRTVGMVVVPPRQRGAVLRRDMHRLKPVARQRIGIGAHRLAVALTGGHVRRGGHLRGGLIVKAHAVDAVGSAQHRCTGRCGRLEQGMLFHGGITSVSIAVFVPIIANSRPHRNALTKKFTLATALFSQYSILIRDPLRRGSKGTPVFSSALPHLLQFKRVSHE